MLLVCLKRFGYLREKTTLSSISQCRKQIQPIAKVIESILLPYFPSRGPKHPKPTFFSQVYINYSSHWGLPSLGGNLTATAGPAKEMKEQEQLGDKAVDKNSCIKLLQYQAPDLP